MVQTPGVVTNVGADGTVTETPVMVTNTAGGAGGAAGYGGSYGGAVGGAYGGAYGGSYGSSSYGYGGSYGTAGVGAVGGGFGTVTQTPAVVTNVSGGGFVTQTPVAVTNVSQGVGAIGGTGMIGVGMGGMGISGIGVGIGGPQVQVVPAPPAPRSTSRVEYVPVQQSVTEYETREWVETVPRQKTLTEYQERRWTESVPREVSRIDHYAIEYLREYVPEVVATTSTQVIPQERLIQRTEYYPVERQVTHGLQGMKQVGGVINVGAAINHQVVSLGVTQGETMVAQGAPMPAQVVNYVPGMATGGALGVSGVRMGATTIGGGYTGASVVPGGVYPGAIGVSGMGAGYGQSFGQTTVTGVTGGYSGYGVGGMGMTGGYGVAGGYGTGMGMGMTGGYRGGAMTQTPGVVTNVGVDGTVTQTPVMVTNTA